MPRKVTSNQDKHFTILSLTTLTGELAICIVIFTRAQQNLQVKTGIDFTKEYISDINNPRFFKQNFGKELSK